MASNRKLSEEVKVYMFEYDGEGPADVGWVPVKNYGKVLVTAMRTVGTGALDDFRILGNPAANGSGTDIVLIDSTSAQRAAADAVGDTIFIEISQAVLDANPTVVAISASIGHATATDESVLTYVLGDPRQVTGALTADVIA